MNLLEWIRAFIHWELAPKLNSSTLLKLYPKFKSFHSPLIFRKKDNSKELIFV